MSVLNVGQVDFHTGLADKRAYVARLVRKASRQGARLVVVCDEPAEVSALLWGGDAVEFVVHATAQSNAETVKASRVLLTTSPVVADRDLSEHVLINAREAWPETHADYSRVIELVSQAPNDVTAGRERWKKYLSVGVQPSKLG